MPLQLSTKLAILTALLLALSRTIMAQSPTIATQTTPLQSTDAESTNPSDQLPPLAPFAIRLHLIRHGETEANLSNLVLGQQDSPLTHTGLELAKRAASFLPIPMYWKFYCSDLYRAHRTAKIVLGIEDVDGHYLNSAIHLEVDSRLRELAKGAREGYPKSLSYGEALEHRRSNTDEDVPLLESINDAWERVQHWINEVLSHAYTEFDSLSPEEKAECISGNKPKIYHVFALSHSALIRTMIHKMCHDELPHNYTKTQEGSLRIPNLSCTRIDVRPYGRERKDGDGGRKKWAWRPSLVTLTDVSHLNDVASSTGPPYL